MPVRFKCNCGTFLQASRKLIGRKIRCPKCGEVRPIPDPMHREKADEARPKRIDTQELEASGFHRLKKAADEGELVALDNDEVEGMNLSPETGETRGPLPREAKLLEKAAKSRPPGEPERHGKPHRAEAPEKHQSDLEGRGFGDEPPERHGKPEKEHRAARPDGAERPPDKGEPAKERAEGRPAKKGEPSIPIQCFCGKNYEFGPEKAGTVFTCEACGRSISIPSGKRESKLELLPEDEGEPCPNCGVLLSSDAKVCRSCGSKIDPRFMSGRKPREPGETTKARLRKKAKRH